jgi:outer membrane protein TolC
MKNLKITLSLALAIFAAAGNLTAQSTNSIAQNTETNSLAQEAGTNSPALNTATNLPVENAGTNSLSWLTRPLSLMDALNIGLQQNATILKAQSDLEASYGIVVQTRAVALPQLKANGQYKDTDRNAIENFPGAHTPNQNWNANVQLVQTIYQGGKLMAAVKAAKVTKEQALAQYQATLQDTLLLVRLAYYDILLAAEQIVVNQASVNLLQKELDDQQRRYDAGTVPHFNVLRAKVAVANCWATICHATSGTTSHCN